MSVAAGRAAVAAAVAGILATPPESLTETFDWSGVRLTLRAGFFHAVQEVEALAARVTPRSETAALAAQLGEARGDFLAALHPFRGEIDSVPAEGEWPVRQTLGHVADALEWWGWLLDRWATSGDLAWPEREEIPDHFRAARPRPGTVEEVRALIEGYADAFTARLAALAPSLDAEVRWGRAQVPLRFYPLRASQHFREHAIQLDKTLAMLGREPSEPERMARVLEAAAGRLEGPYLAGEADQLGEALGPFTARITELFPPGPVS